MNKESVSRQNNILSHDNTLSELFKCYETKNCYHYIKPLNTYKSRKNDKGALTSKYFF